MSQLEAFIFFGGLVLLICAVILGETGSTPIFRRRK